MNQDAARQLIRDTFEQPFDGARFSYFVRELFNHYDGSSGFSHQGPYIPTAFRDHVRQFKRIGTYSDPNGQNVDILIVHLKREGTLDRARTMQRNFVARHLKQRDEKDAAVVAYTSDDSADWRFSLVRMEYKITQDEEGALHFETELTPARRFSFLVGENEPNHTAKKQLLPILIDSQNDPTLDQLVDAFNIESVTREFFEEYKALFLRLNEELDAICKRKPAVRDEFRQKGITTVNFAKKLLGQIVFLYFLQKKGWLGVAPADDWGRGPKDFLRRLYQRQYVRYDNFFNDILEPLFYEALAIERPDHLYPRLKCRIPFLNGGLFEPVSDYDWQKLDISISNETIGAVLDIFDLYNFTVRESEPLEKEVAVDPEMLGKVFENLLEVTDRKSKGAFYTPREVVHYMCQESLISYLDTALNWEDVSLVAQQAVQAKLFGVPELRQQSLKARSYVNRVPREDIERFVREGELALDNEMAAAAGVSNYRHKLPQSIRAAAAEIDRALAEAKICDPAIGSGAFPVGMMQEIVRARRVLATYLDGAATTPYNLKRHAIQHSLYGVDVDPAAVDIAKLRLWLSLVVDEEDYRTIKPLPNLGYKIVRGDSLAGARDFDPLLKSHLMRELRELKPRYFAAADLEKKRRLQLQIDDLLQQATGGVFDYIAYFGEVFEQQGGFDVVIGNPPYVRQELIRELKPTLKQNFPEVYSGVADIYVYFYARGIELLREQGTLAYITSNKFMRAGYGRKLRSFLADQTQLQAVIDFGDLPLFEATTYPCIVVAQKRKPAGDHKLHTLIVERLDVLQQLPLAVTELSWSMPQTALQPAGWTLVQPDVLALMRKLRRQRTPLADYVDGKFHYGIKTGFNTAFVVDAATRQQLIEEDPRSAEVIKPWLRGRDIKRWCAKESGTYLIFTLRGTAIDKYPAIKKYLSQFREKLMPKPENWKGKNWPGRKAGSYKWYEIQDTVAYFEEFAKPKIIYPHFNTRPNFAYDRTGALSNDKTYIIPDGSFYLLGILNSNVTDFFLRQICPSVQQAYMEFRTIYVGQVPICDANDQQRIQLEALVGKLLDVGGQGPRVAQWEQQLNDLVYQLYDLTPDEIALIEERSKSES